MNTAARKAGGSIALPETHADLRECSCANCDTATTAELQLRVDEFEVDDADRELVRDERGRSEKPALPEHVGPWFRL